MANKRVKSARRAPDSHERCGIMRLRIEYYDQNERFAPLLPRDGIVVSEPACADSSLAWHLLRLDVPISYEGVEYSHFLVASRWQEQPIGAAAPTSVFILLVSSANAVSDGFSHKQFPHVAWGMARVVSAEQALGGGNPLAPQGERYNAKQNR